MYAGVDVRVREAAGRFEYDVLLAPGADLDQRTMAILGALQDPGETDFGGRPVWAGYVDQPAAQRLRVSEAHRDHPGEATVAIIDTGVDPDHPLLSAALVPGYDFLREEPGLASEWHEALDQRTMAILGQRTMAILGGEEVVPVNPSTAVIVAGADAGELDPGTLPPAFGHGTMVAGIIHRVAPGARLMPLRVFDGHGRGNLVDVVRAIYYAVDRGANVINMSFSLEVFSPELMRAVNYASRQGVACVAAAGNEGRETLVYPAALGNALVTIAAPGENLVTAYPGGGWALASGTSFAAPWISGAVAVFADKNGKKHDPGAADYYLAAAALSHAVPVHGSGDAAGYGRADLKRAIDKLHRP